LAVGDPVRAGRRAVAQELLGDDVALEEASLAAAVLLGPRDADPTLLPHRPAELGRTRVPARETGLALDDGPYLLEDGAHLHAKRFRLRRQMEGREFELGNGHRRLPGWMRHLCRLMLDGATGEFRGSMPRRPPRLPPMLAEFDDDEREAVLAANRTFYR